jgi:hypothetical protein
MFNGKAIKGIKVGALYIGLHRNFAKIATIMTDICGLQCMSEKPSCENGGR